MFSVIYVISAKTRVAKTKGMNITIQKAKPGDEVGIVW